MSAVMREVLLVRHGETPYNAEGRFRGRADPPLTERGRLQAAAVARALARLPVGMLVSSPRLRARQTAEPLAEALGRKVVVDDRLDDIDYGEWTGLSRDEVGARWPASYGLWLSAPQRLRIPGGESIAAARDRVWGALSELAWGSAPVVAVTHDACIRLAVGALLGAPLVSMHAIRVDLASMTQLAFRDDGTELVRANDASHLKDLVAQQATSR